MSAKNPNPGLLKFGKDSVGAFLIFSIILVIGMTIYNLIRFSGWVYDDLLIIFSLLGIYYAYRKFKLTKWVVLVLYGAILFHSLGSFGFYSKVFILPFDKYVHFIVPMALTLFFWDFLSVRTTLSVFEKFIFAVFVVVGLSNIIEIIEFFSIRFLGPGEGVLFAGTEDFFPVDTISDIINNLLGCLFGAFLMVLRSYRL